MIIRHRKYKKEPASREAKKIHIFCEGRRTEHDYFSYFVEMDSRINIMVQQMAEDDDTTPTGVFQKAEDFFSENELEDIDEVWLVFDRDYDTLDSRKPQIEEIRAACISRSNWNIALSNPCFEVWLYFHFQDKAPDFEGLDVSTNWKRHLAETVKGGFDRRKHPILIKTAIENSKFVHSTDANNEPLICSTEVFLLAESIIPLVEKELSRRLKALGM